MGFEAYTKMYLLARVRKDYNSRAIYAHIVTPSRFLSVKLNRIQYRSPCSYSEGVVDLCREPHMLYFVLCLWVPALRFCDID